MPRGMSVKRYKATEKQMNLSQILRNAIIRTVVSTLVSVCR